MTIELTITPHEDVDPGKAEQQTLDLRAEIAALAVESVDLGRGRSALPGAKGDPVTVSSIVVALASAGVFTGLVELLKSWALRREGRSVSIKAEVDGRKLELTFSPAEASEEKMARFAERILHTLGEGKK